MKKMTWIARLLKPFMNERGDTGGTPDPPADGIARDENGFIPGTTFKSVEELTKGFQETKADHGRISNEYGNLKKDHERVSGQAETLANLLKENLTKAPAAAPADQTDYGKEISAVRTELENLDPLDKDFAKTQGKLISKLTSLTAAETKDKVLSIAGSQFQEELSKRDNQAAKQKFLDANPTFNTPEMQAKIKDFIANDRTGMHDPMSAFFQIQRDDLAAQTKTLQEQNAEMQKVLELAKGKDATGKVVVKGANITQPTKQTKVTGQDLNAGMLAAAAAARGE
jgi:hypothetical protein